ncbi:unnamed protein product [Caenorhabditis brenneri]
MALLRSAVNKKATEDASTSQDRYPFRHKAQKRRSEPASSSHMKRDDSLSPSERKKRKVVTEKRKSLSDITNKPQIEKKRGNPKGDTLNVVTAFRPLLQYSRNQLKQLKEDQILVELLKLETTLESSEHAQPPKVFKMLSDGLISKIRLFETDKNFQKKKRDMAKMIRLQIAAKLDATANSFGYCCGSHHVLDSDEEEQKIRCKQCRKKSHVVCAQWNPLHDGPASEFICKNCRPAPKRVVSMTKLQTTPSSDFIETGINEFMGTLDSLETPGRISCRIVACIRRNGRMSDENKKQYPGLSRLMDDIPHTYKLYAITQQIEGQDVLVYMLAVNEYSGKGVPAHKQGLVSILFLDTVKYLQPYKFSRKINQKFLQLYLQNAQQRGFQKARIYARPPTSSDPDFLFHCHPEFKKNLSQQGLFVWYRQAVRTLTQELNSAGIQATFKNSFDPSHCKTVKNLCEELYLEEGFWPNFLERNLGKPLTTLKKLIKEESEDRDNCQFYIYFDDNKRKTVDASQEDPFIHSEIGYTRDAWMDAQIENDWQFDSARRATYSTMMLISSIEDERKKQSVKNKNDSMNDSGIDMENDENAAPSSPN